MRKLKYWGALLLVMGFAGCSEITLIERAPDGYQITGTWLIDDESSDAVPDLRRAGLPNKRNASRRQAVLDQALGSPLAFIAHDFQVLHATRLDIEQNPDSMGVRYHPGVYRDVTWGKRRRGLWQVDAGWFEGNLVVQSEADGLLVRETFFASTGSKLTVNVFIKADDLDPVIYRRQYTRLTR